MRGKNRKARRVSGEEDSLYSQTWACLSNVFRGVVNINNLHTLNYEQKPEASYI